MPGGQQINGAQGTITALGGDGNIAVTGSVATAAAGQPALNRLLPLRSRKSGTGTASAALAGLASSGGHGVLGVDKAFALAGSQSVVVQGTVIYGGRATLQWLANSEPDLAGYRVYRGTTSGVYTEMRDVGNVLIYVWDGLTPGFTHYFVVTAYDTSNNEGANSAEVSKAF